MPATIAATAWPPPERTEIAANCAEPAKVAADMTRAATPSIPGVEVARTPNETPNRPTTAASGAARTIAWRAPVGAWGSMGAVMTPSVHARATRSRCRFGPVGPAGPPIHGPGLRGRGRGLPVSQAVPPAAPRGRPTSVDQRRASHLGFSAQLLRLREEGRVGFEPTTRGLKVPCSTTELTARRFVLS